METGRAGKFEPPDHEFPSVTPTLTSADIQFSSRVDQTAALIKRAILEGRLKGGDRIREAKLATTLRIGQPTVREALIQLQHRGLLVRIPHRGTFVARMGDEQAAESYRVREYLEVLALKLARSRVTDEGLARVRAHLKDMEEAAARGDRVALFEADLAFHREVWKMSGNKCLANTLEFLTGPVLAGGSVLVLQGGKGPSPSATAASHQRIANCLTEGTDQDVERIVHEVYSDFQADYYQYAAQAAAGKHEVTPRKVERIRDFAGSLTQVDRRRSLESKEDLVVESEANSVSLRVKVQASRRRATCERRVA